MRTIVVVLSLRTILVLMAVTLIAANGVLLAPAAAAAVPRGPVCVQAGVPCGSWWHPHDRTGDRR